MAAVPHPRERPTAPPLTAAAAAVLLAALTVLAGPVVLARVVLPGGGDGATAVGVGGPLAAGPDPAAPVPPTTSTSAPGPAPTAPPVPPPAAATPASAPAVVPAAGEPDRIVIPAIDVDAPVVDLELDDDGALEVPDWDDAGWWRQGTRPGDPGPAVIVGHVDSRTGPAVFYELDELTPGDTIEVTLDGGAAARFAVQHVERFAKDEFPTLDVYGITPGPELRVVTCGGDFDDDTGHYLDNVVVFATAI